MKYVASIDPQTWVNDYAFSVDPPGDTDWDCTPFVQAHPNLFDGLGAALAEWGEWLDRDDVLMDDDAKPAWAGEWSGPFTITVRAEAV